MRKYRPGKVWRVTTQTLLDTLHEYGLRGKYFFEGINPMVNPTGNILQVVGVVKPEEVNLPGTNLPHEACLYIQYVGEIDGERGSVLSRKKRSEGLVALSECLEYFRVERVDRRRK